MKTYFPEMISRLTRREIIITILVLIIYSVGVAGITLPQTRDLFIRMIPAVILLSLATMLAFHTPRPDNRTIAVFSAIIILSWMIEAAGVSTGFIFGSYSYGPALGVKIFQTPLVIGLNWLLLIYGSACLIRKIKEPAIRIFLASAVMVLYDIGLELVAPLLGMWKFEGGKAPVTNYIAWFLIAALFHTGLIMAGLKLNNRVASVIFVIQCLFFIVLAILFNLS